MQLATAVIFLCCVDSYRLAAGWGGRATIIHPPTVAKSPELAAGSPLGLIWAFSFVAVPERRTYAIISAWMPRARAIFLPAELGLESAPV